MRYRCASRHVEDLSDGRTVAPGEAIELDAKEDHDRRLVEEGKLLPIEEAPKSRSKKRSGGGDDNNEGSGD